MTNYKNDWYCSLHGGHSGEFCEHAEGKLEDLVQRAIALGIRIYGMTEHAPRYEERFLFFEERQKGYTISRLEEEFAGFAEESLRLTRVYTEQIGLLRGFEIETAPQDDYAASVARLRSTYGFDYIVGSVHFIDNFPIDYTRAHFEAASAHYGSLEKLGIRYYECVAEMISSCRPEVVGHLDLIRKLALDEQSVDTPLIRAAAYRALDAAAETGSLLDINTGGLRRRLGRPYPAPWLLAAARERGIGVCFGDDAHRASEVGAGIEEAREYLLRNGYEEITVLEREGTKLVRQAVSLLDSKSPD